MKHLAPFRLFAIFTVSFPAFANAHPGHGGGEGAEHDLAHFALGLAALLFTLGLGLAAKKVNARRRAKKEESSVKRTVPQSGR
jgi:hydrogenase/urease accessory protein HupE